MSTMTRFAAAGRPVPLLAGAILIAALAASSAVPADESPLERGFRQPPASARSPSGQAGFCGAGMPITSSNSEHLGAPGTCGSLHDTSAPN